MAEYQKVYNNISSSMLSIAKRYGGCIINGIEYVYIPENDSLVDKQEYERSNKKKKDTTKKNDQISFNF